MKLDKALRREARQKKARTGMRVTGKSVFVIKAVLDAKTAAAKAAAK
jgi:hypothetical protein